MFEDLDVIFTGGGVFREDAKEVLGGAVFDGDGDVVFGLEVGDVF